MEHKHQAQAAKHTAGTTAPPSLAMSEEIEDCIAACVACHAICLQTAFHCLNAGESRAHARHIRTLLDCAELCQSAVRFMFANSVLQSRVCALCAEACRACEAECRAMGEAQDLRCAEACACCAGMLHRAHAALEANRTLNDGW